jgi:hypothetical protein
MRFDFNISDDSLKKIQAFGLENRVNELKNSKEGLGYIGGYFSSMDVVRSVKWLIEDGYYKNIPKDFKKKYEDTMNAMLKNPENFYWTINRYSGMDKTPCVIEDMRLFTGEFASYILKPDEMWDYSRFGFDSPTDFIGSVSAFIIQQSHSNYRGGYSWTRNNSSGAKILTEITGDHNADLRVIQSDTTFYETLDPFKNNVGFRPETSNDKFVMSPYHSTEPYLLVAVLKYMEQQNILDKLSLDKRNEIINYANSISPGAITCTEHFGDSHDNLPLLFINHSYPISKLDKNNFRDQKSIHNLYCMSNGWYSAYTDFNNNLIFAYEDINTIETKLIQSKIVFTIDDSIEIIKGLMYQSAKHLGRTSVGTLVNMLNYRFSEQFDKDMLEFSK